METLHDNTTAPQQTMLMVDDDQELCELMVQVFGEAGYRVIAASNPWALNSLLSYQPIAIAVVDLHLPERGAFIACRAIRELAGPNVPLLLLALDREMVEREEVKALGAVDCMICGYWIEDLVDRVKQLCPLPSDSF